MACWSNACSNTPIMYQTMLCIWHARNSILYPIAPFSYFPFHTTRAYNGTDMPNCKKPLYTIHCIQQSKDTIHFCKVKAYACILGSRCTDATAICSAKIKVVIISSLIPHLRNSHWESQSLIWKISNVLGRQSQDAGHYLCRRKKPCTAAGFDTRTTYCFVQL